MKISAKIFIVLTFVSLLAVANIASWVSSNLKPRYREAVEDSLVDLSVVFASLLGQSDSPGAVASKIMEKVQSVTFKAKVYSLSKSEVDIRVYVTDKSGKLIYSSYRPADIGKDYSQWRDVSLTLKGEYGARSTKDDQADPSSTVLYVAAPIYVGKRIEGVVTIGKPTEQINNYAALERNQIAWRLLLTGAIVLLIGGIVSWSLTRAINRLTVYARAVRDGKAIELPSMPNDEIGELAKAFEEMRVALEGKKYIEHYIQNLTHELKSPISGIQGAVELLRENPAEEIRNKFLRNVSSDIERMKSIVDRLLELSSIEGQSALNKIEAIHLKSLITQVIYSQILFAADRKVNLLFDENRDIQILGDSFLIRQAILNLLDNAISFAKSKVEIKLTEVENAVEILVVDDGAGIPEYAQARVFERFYSLPRPDTQRKSSGLGLCLVKEVMRLHRGKVIVSNALKSGASVKLEFPK